MKLTKEKLHQKLTDLKGKNEELIFTQAVDNIANVLDYIGGSPENKIRFENLLEYIYIKSLLGEDNFGFVYEDTYKQFGVLETFIEKYGSIDRFN